MPNITHFAFHNLSSVRVTYTNKSNTSKNNPHNFIYTRNIKYLTRIDCYHLLLSAGRSVMLNGELRSRQGRPYSHSAALFQLSSPPLFLFSSSTFRSSPSLPFASPPAPKRPRPLPFPGKEKREGGGCVMPVSVGGMDRGRPLHAGEAGGRGEKKELRGRGRGGWAGS